MAEHYCCSTADIPDGIITQIAEEHGCPLEEDRNPTPEESAAFMAVLEQYRCGKPARFSTGSRNWFCAEHWDRLMKLWREEVEAGPNEFVDEDDIAEMKEDLERYGR
jgi:hypothetical protein